MLTVGVFPNIRKKNMIKVAKSLVTWFEDRAYRVKLSMEVAELLDMSYLSADPAELTSKIDVAVTLGGDGTLLGVARLVAQHKIPILGINMGHVGFLTEVELGDLFTDLECFHNKEYDIDVRMMLEAKVIRNEKVLTEFLALNDIVITKGPFARLIRLKTYANEAYVDTYPADGLIISTPTGSTAYSLSAGGPIIRPDMNLLLLTPICPHTLHSRSIILSQDDVIKVTVLADHPEVMLTVDGQEGYKLLPKDTVIVNKSSFSTRLIRIKKRSFYDLLRKKLSE
ncbi:MAG: NAD(+)/NADH kinase [Tepidanaerobacteraceae bacterium]|jgi:NAD+ kinase|nr:NAD(+)/NADH kinase [Tepidanaerobacter sp.]HQE04783.1 NAD(+)/NADH kinase [Tepidanaerobacteraceae bacterium]